jgi:ABC-type hemin transport system ATPase subunit
MQALRQRWGVLFQQGALFSALTAFENVAQPLRELRYLPEDLIRDTVLLKLGMVELSPQDALKMPADLSGGMVKRVALARALACAMSSPNTRTVPLVGRCKPSIWRNTVVLPEPEPPTSDTISPWSTRRFRS